MVDLADGARALPVIGPPRSGRTTVLACLLAQVRHRSGIRTVLLAPARSPAHHAATSAGALASDFDRGLPTAEGDALLVLIDDCEQIAGTPAEDQVLARLRTRPEATTVVAAGSTDGFAVAFRGLLAQLRRVGCGILLQPGPGDGELLGVGLPRQRRAQRPGRGLLVSDPGWGLPRTLPLQVALPEPTAQPMCG
jgi:S-DNA-T family DNA segregation ATPase FtsK/SpoIIIE